MSLPTQYEALFITLTNLQYDFYSHPFVNSVFGSLVLSLSFLVLVLGLVTHVLSMPPSPPPLPKDTIVLHISPRPDKSIGIASLSPEALSLEAFLRMSKTRYETHISPLCPPKGIRPTLLSFNDTKISDVHIAIAWILKNNRAGKNLNTTLEDSVELGAVEAYHCLLDQLSCSLTYLRFTHPLNSSHITHQLYKHSGLSIPQTMIQRRKTKQRALETLEAVGLLQHSRDDILELMHARLCALEALLNGDEYFMGTSEPTVLDAIAFGVLANFVLVPMPGSDEGVVWVQGALQFVQFVRRVSEKYFKEFSGPLNGKDEEPVMVDGIHMNSWGDGGKQGKRKGFDWNAVEQRAVDLWNLSHRQENACEENEAPEEAGVISDSLGTVELDQQETSSEEPYMDLVEKRFTASKTLSEAKNQVAAPLLDADAAEIDMQEIAQGV
ncbi:hypothetical protein BDR26DRAFT_873874 [Obelidium mucronatum]|nr:hypothetical protein BDR26DRAFT_873874 [Obelidium mucronatum]